MLVVFQINFQHDDLFLSFGLRKGNGMKKEMRHFHSIIINDNEHL